jgi:hypothetical protein
MPRFVPGFVKRGLASVGSRMIRWLREWTKPDSHGLVGGAVADATRSKSELMLENALLRQQLIVLDRQVKRPQLSWRERGIMVLLASQLGHSKHSLFIEQPDTDVLATPHIRSKTGENSCRFDDSHTRFAPGLDLERTR